ncbi:MAG TPA: hypothetical protein VEP68_02865 [Anaeromyxobacteraceae bacterium]|nr:hypothetical protein [Anaeromyxobacteraceae bacterium]
MKILHILRSEPDDLVRRLIKALSEGESSNEIPLYRGAVDYPKLVASIFGSDRVICWW